MDEKKNDIQCPKQFTTPESIVEGFNADDICMSCENIVYKDGVISCKYARVN